MTVPGDDWRTSETRALFEAILVLDDLDEAAAFFRDLCTRRELEEMSHRWTVARLLDQGLPYREIAEETGASTATISRINQWLQHGTGGYRRMLDKTQEPA
jgi:TrpR-related protein YerC/YecD